MSETNVPLYKGYENPEKQIIALWLDYRLRIEMLEDIHLHYGDDGEHRLELSPREFIELAEGIAKVEVE